MALTEIQKRLFELQDIKYRGFQAKLIPTVRAERIIGVRTPELRKYAKELSGTAEADEFLKSLPHEYFDEDQLHAFIISGIKDFLRCAEEVQIFLPYIDNWATCDQLSPKVFKKHRQKLLPFIDGWLGSDKTYTVRFGIGMLMQHFLDDNFDISYPERIAEIRSDEYYINMMTAWYFATALTKQYDAVLPFIEEGRLDTWTHNKAIQKAAESFRVPEERKAYLKTLRRKAKESG